MLFTYFLGNEGFGKLSGQSLKQIEVHKNFLSDAEFNLLIENITKIQDKFQVYLNESFRYERIFLNDYFKDNPIQILTRDFLENLGYNNKNLDITITSYGTGENYEWHDDNTSNRTHNYILYLTDQKLFEGGELEVKTNGKIQTIIPKKNTLIIMDAKLEHRVLPVQTKIGGIWQLSRLTLNGHIRN